MAHQHDDLDPEMHQRRGFLLRMLALGAFSSSSHLRADTRIIVASRSIHLLEGTVFVNGVKATIDTPISAKDRIQTEHNGRIVFSVGHDAFILRNNSALDLSNNGLLIGGLRLLTGKMLAVFGKSKHQITTSTATVGIRGTGVYTESTPDLTYFCTCYGTTKISSIAKPSNVANIVSKHHDAAKYISKTGAIIAAPFINHTDEELALIESLVGRTTPFAAFDDGYSGPSKY